MLLFNRYQYQPSTDLIGKGELTRVYKALDKEIYLPVAVKIYRGNDPAEQFGLVQVDKFIAMDHPNICRYLHIEEMEKESAFGEKEKMQVCVMELVADGDFATYYQARRQPELLRKMVTDILRGLAYLHSQGIVHRRLKASNLLVGETTQGPVVKITDFGLGSGKAALKDAHLSSVVMAVTHMAPEQFNARKYGVDGKVSYHLDFWALGMAVYEALTDNDVLFKNSPEDSREQVIQNILSPALPEKVKRLPAPFDGLVARCLAKHADDRAQNTRELLELLAEPVTAQDDVYDTLVMPATALHEQEEERLATLVREEAEEDHTQVLPARVVRVVVEDDTKILPHEPDETKILPKEPAVAGPVVTAGDDTRVLPKEGRDTVAGTMRSDENHYLFNRYEYNPRTGLIGKGGFSRVYKAFDKKLSRWVALKIYKTGEFSDRYSPIAEIRRVINLDHSNICRYLDIEEIEKENAFGEKEITQICVMELLDGGNLLEYYTAHPTDEVLQKLLNDVLRGLTYLHKNGIIHRDVKPANILIKETHDGPVAKITDFGISKMSDSINNHSSSALVVSIPYMAPEQLNVKKYGIQEKISYNLDLWALGVTIYEIITGKILFKNSDQDTSEQIMANIMAPGLPEKIAELPQPFLDIVRRCVVKDARERVQKAEELILLLNGVADRPAATGGQGAVGRGAGNQGAVGRATGSQGPDTRAFDRQASTPVATSDTGSRTRRSFIVDDEEAPEVKRKPAAKQERWLSWLRVAVIAAAVLLAISLYIYMQNRKLNDAVSFPAPKVDSTGIVSDQTKKASATATNPESAGSQPNKDAVKTAAGSAGVTDEAERKPHKNAEGRKEHASGGDEKATKGRYYTLVLTTVTSRNIVINNIPYNLLESGRSMKVPLTPGTYLLQATSTTNPKDVYTGRLNVPPGYINKVGSVQIP